MLGTAQMSFSSRLLEGNQLSSKAESDIKWCAASLYAGMGFLAYFAVNLIYIYISGGADTVCMLMKAEM